MSTLPDPGPAALAQLVLVGLEAARPTLAPVGGRYLVGIGGSVAVGKSHLAGELAAALGDAGVAVDVVTTDGFLLPNAELEARGLTLRKGFPETFDRAALVDFLVAAVRGVAPLHVPRYDHFRYDVVPGPGRTVAEAEVLVVEGLCLLGPGAAAGGVRIADLLALRIGVDADDADIRRWYRERFVAHATRAVDEPGGFWDLFAGWPDDELRVAADLTWEAVNEPNLREHVRPGLAEVDVLVRKGADHRIVEVDDRRAR